MIDASTLFYKEKVRLMKETVSLVSLYGADIEAELGSIGVRETGEGNSSGADDPSKIYTNPSLAGQFVKKMWIRDLACSFGTTHGIYLSEPRLDFDVERGVRKETNGIPIVIHGGNGVSKKNFQTAVQAGVRKINCFTYMDKSGRKHCCGISFQC